jgi:hypothetical protein
MQDTALNCMEPATCISRCICTQTPLSVAIKRENTSEVTIVVLYEPWYAVEDKRCFFSCSSLSPPPHSFQNAPALQRPPDRQRDPPPELAQELTNLLLTPIFLLHLFRITVIFLLLVVVLVNILLKLVYFECIILRQNHFQQLQLFPGIIVHKTLYTVYTAL